MRRIISLSLALLFVLGFFVSCAEEGSPAVSTTENTVPTTEAAQPTTEKLLPDLPDMDFEGHSFTFLLKGDEHSEWASLDIASEGENGEVINDSIYNRNIAVEEKYNIKIAWNRTGDVNGTFKKSYAAGDDLYDAFMPDLPSASIHARSGMLYDLKQLQYIDLSKPWWDSRAAEELTVGGRLLYCVSDISYTAIDTIWIMMFNKGMIKDNNLEDPYEIVKRGDWTFDKLEEMIKGVSRDVNGDGIVGVDDIAGFVSPADRYVRAMVLAAGESFSEKTDDDFFAFKEPNATFIEVFDKGMALMHSNPDVLDINDIKDQGTSNLTNRYFLAKKMFEENRVLFFSEVMQNIVRLRQMDKDFGIIPLPKYKKEQDYTPHYVFIDTTTVITVPANCSNPERTGIILEALAGESHYTLIPTYYDVALKNKYARDEASAEMMDIILASRTYDLASVYNFGGIYPSVTNNITQNKESYTTTIDKIRDKINKDVDKIIEQYKSVA
ncbi:MAG: hypothetical protein AB9835_12485 [Eubacteriales bacterium]